MRSARSNALGFPEVESENDAEEGSSRTPNIIPFGPASDAIITHNHLPQSLHTELFNHEKDDHHTDWYWKLVDGALLGHDTARALARAMHIDRELEWDEKECMNTPFSPWDCE